MISLSELMKFSSSIGRQKPTAKRQLISSPTKERPQKWASILIDYLPASAVLIETSCPLEFEDVSVKSLATALGYCWFHLQLG